MFFKGAKNFDVVIYGGTSAGVVAAVQARRMGKSIVLVSPEKHLGGMTSSGLEFTDVGCPDVIGGLAREFYHRIYEHYQHDDAWRWQKRSDYPNKGQGVPAIDDERSVMWVFEPHVAEQIFEDLVSEYKIPVYRNERLNRDNGVEKEGLNIISIRMLSNREFSASVFIDATYEGDLMAAAGISYIIGRESKKLYGERCNGVQTTVREHEHTFDSKISPYVVPNQPLSGLLPRVSSESPGTDGQGDRRVEAYCFRMCLTSVSKNCVPFPKPIDYDPNQYELLLRLLAVSNDDVLKLDPIPNDKIDANSYGPFSIDDVGMNYEYPESSYERRRRILAEHEGYQKGFLYFLANDSRLPKRVLDTVAMLGLSKDEFADNGNWPYQIYIREARRMIGPHVMTEHNLLGKHEISNVIGMGSYSLDSHNVQRYVTKENFVQNEGHINVQPSHPYGISLESIVPKPTECSNIIVPVCLSSSHAAYGSIRTEPTFMVLGHSAASLAALAVDSNCRVQSVDYAELQQTLLSSGQILRY